MRPAQSAFIVCFFGLLLSVSPARAEVQCAVAAAPLSGLAAQKSTPRASKFDVVACADEEQGNRNTKAEAELAKQAASLIHWITTKTGWSVHDSPPIRFVPKATLVKMFSETSTGLHVEALYSERDHSIYLANGWRADNLRRRSILLHELVHHLQYLNHAKVTCQSEYEVQALQLQVTWLGDQGVDDPFDLIGLDPLWLMMLKKCDEMAY
jgi:Domain of unknown function (DUF6647)